MFDDVRINFGVHFGFLMATTITSKNAPHSDPEASSEDGLESGLHLLEIGSKRQVLLLV